MLCGNGLPGKVSYWHRSLKSDAGTKKKGHLNLEIVFHHPHPQEGRGECHHELESTCKTPPTASSLSALQPSAYLKMVPFLWRLLQAHLPPPFCHDWFITLQLKPLHCLCWTRRMLLAWSHTPFCSTYLSVLVKQGLPSLTVLKTSTLLLYSCYLCVGNTTSNHIALGNAVKQGCPVNPILFNLVALAATLFRLYINIHNLLS